MVAFSKLSSRLASAVTESDRRMFPRKAVSVRIGGRRLDHSLDARQRPYLNLTLQDLSLGGLSAVTDTPLGRGEHLSVHFPSSGEQRSWDAFGRVIRCEPSHFGYRLAVEFDPLPAA